MILKTMKENLLSFALSLVLLLALTPISYLSPVGGIEIGHNLLLVVAAVCFSVFTVWRLVKSNNKAGTIISIVLPPFLVFVPVHIIYFYQTAVSLASASFHFIGIFFGVLIFYSKSRPKKIVLFSTLIACCLMMYFK